jgi:hypothetical protein
MRRREFIAGLGSAAAWPVVAQQGISTALDSKTFTRQQVEH